jgi:hypothetical protein
LITISLAVLGQHYPWKLPILLLEQLTGKENTDKVKK